MIIAAHNLISVIKIKFSTIENCTHLPGNMHPILKQTPEQLLIPRSKNTGTVSTHLIDHWRCGNKSNPIFSPDIDLWGLSWSCFQDEPDSWATDTQTIWAQHTSLQEKLIRTHSATIVSRLDWLCEHCHGLLSTKRGFGWQGLWNNAEGEGRGV